MAVLGAAFQIGRSALAAYQSALSVAGQNIANVGNPDYVRQSGRLASIVGGPTLGGIAPGAGVNLTALRRHVDDALEARLRQSVGSRAGSEQTWNTLNSIESAYNELSDQNLSSQLSAFFASFAAVQTDPTDLTARNLVINAADGAIRTIQRQRSTLLDQVEQLNGSAEAAADRANEISNQVADLNRLIVTAQARGNGGEAPLKDRRDALVRELSEYMDIQVRNQSNGSVNVYVGSTPLVEFDRSRGIHTVRQNVDGLEIAEVRFLDDKSLLDMRDGRLGRLVESRDVHVRGQLDQLDQLSRGMIYEINRVHSSGRGLVGLTSVTSSFDVDDMAAALNSAAANLDYPVKNGTFLVKMRNQQTGEVTTHQINIDLDGLGTDTSLESLATQLSSIPGLAASVTTDRRLQLAADPNVEFSFAEDSSGALAALGIGGFFEGTNAVTIAVRGDVRSDPRLLAASISGEVGDGDNAGRLARIGNTASSILNNRTIEQFRTEMVTTVAVAASGAKDNYEAQDAVYSSLRAQREAISGVSLDEEAINLQKYEKAFEGAARYLSVVDQLGTTVLSLVS